MNMRTIVTLIFLTGSMAAFASSPPSTSLVRQMPELSSIFTNETVTKAIEDAAGTTGKVEVVVTKNLAYRIFLTNGIVVTAIPLWSEEDPNVGLPPRFLGFEVEKQLRPKED